MNHAAKLAGDAGMSPDERSALLGNRGEPGGDATKQLLDVLGQIRDIAEAVVDGRAGALWSDECMNQLIVGVELGLAQGWNEVVDAFSDAGRVLQTYENAGRPDDSTLYLIDAYGLLCGLVTDSMSGAMRPAVTEKWRARHHEEIATLEAAGLTLVSDDFETEEAQAESPFDMPDISVKNIVKLRPQEDLPSLDELPPLDSVVSGTKPGAQQKKPAVAAPPQAQERPAQQRVAKSPVEVAREAEEAKAKSDRRAANAMEQAEIAAASGKGIQPSQTIVEFVDRICEELAGLSQHSVDERILSLEMIQGGIAALKREAVKDGHRHSGELCEQMAQACLFVSQSDNAVDERFTDLAFGFCGVYVEAMNNASSENVEEWRAECARLIEDWAESEAAQSESTTRQEMETTEFESEAAVEIEPELPAATPVQPAAAAPEPVAPVSPPMTAVAPAAAKAATPMPAAEPARPTIISTAPVNLARQGLKSADLFVRAQEALSRGDGEAAKTLALQAAAMIAESEIDKAEARLRDAEARFKANVSATEEARSEVKHGEKLVMNAASDVAASETHLGQAKSTTAKAVHDVQESEAEVSEIERQIAELKARRDEQVRDVETKKSRLDDAKRQEYVAEAQVETLRDAEKDARKSLEGARQRVKDHQRLTGEIENDMERAREMLSRQRGSFADIMQTINRPEPIKTGENGEDRLLF